MEEETGCNCTKTTTVLLQNIIKDQQDRIAALENELNKVRIDSEAHQKNLGKTEVMSDVLDKLWQILLSSNNPSRNSNSNSLLFRTTNGMF